MVSGHYIFLWRAMLMAISPYIGWSISSYPPLFSVDGQ
jgi:hypothetical protein